MFGVHILALLVLSFSSNVEAASVNYSVPPVTPGNAAELDPAPIGASFEFFMWPSYMTNITPPVQCMQHFSKLYGQKMPIRIGGTTQDRATYDPNFTGYVSYSVADPLDAPMTLTYGPKFFDLVKSYGAETMLGFNRGDNNRTNTYQAVEMAKSKVLKQLWAVELGNEPDFYLLLWKKPVATDPWNQETEGADAANWAQGFIDVWKSPLPILAAGSYAVPYQIYPDWPNTDYLISTAYNKTIKDATKFYQSHLYRSSTGTTLPNEMNHANTVADVVPFVDSVAKARSVGREHYLCETNFHADDTTQDRTFGAALVTLDKSLQVLSVGVPRLFFHQGTINQAYFNWWSDNQVNAPFYGAFFAALAVADGDHIIASDKGIDSYAQYVIYRMGKPFKVVLINTDYYSGTGARNETTFQVSGLKSQKVLKAVRLTATSSEEYVGRTLGSSIPAVAIGGQWFSNDNCGIKGGSQKYENVQVVQGGSATLILKASEALLITCDDLTGTTGTQEKPNLNSTWN